MRADCCRPFRGNAAFPGNHLYSDGHRIVKPTQLPARVSLLSVRLVGIFAQDFLHPLWHPQYIRSCVPVAFAGAVYIPT